MLLLHSRHHTSTEICCRCHVLVHDTTWHLQSAYHGERLLVTAAAAVAAGRGAEVLVVAVVAAAQRIVHPLPLALALQTRGGAGAVSRTHKLLQRTSAFVDAIASHVAQQSTS